jgi:hypothetical protein
MKLSQGVSKDISPEEQLSKLVISEAEIAHEKKIQTNTLNRAVCQALAPFINDAALVLQQGLLDRSPDCCALAAAGVEVIIVLLVLFFALSIFNRFELQFDFYHMKGVIVVIVGGFSFHQP